MPVYPYKCERCGAEWEAAHPVAERRREFCCGRRATLLIARTQKPVACDYFSDAMNIRITGPRQRAEYMKKHNLAFKN